MIIIIEGPDGAGKSTLAKQLSEQTGYPVVHRSKPETEEEKQRMHEMYRESIVSGANMIFDRCWYSEMVYGPVMRDQSYISRAGMLELELAIAENGGGIIIYCSGTTDDLWDNCRARGEDYIKDYSDMLNIHIRYNRLMKVERHVLPVVTYEIPKVH